MSLRTGAAILVVAAACLMAPRQAAAGAGAEDGFGYTWVDSFSGCPGTVTSFGSGVRDLAGQTGVVGPFPLGFTMPFYDGYVTEVWISATGYVTFTDQGPAASSTQVMPTATAPNDMIAAHWAASVVDSTIRYEAKPDLFHVQWLQRIDPASTSRWLTDLIINKDGSFQIRWLPPRRYDNVTIGHEDSAGTRGRTIWRDGFGEPTFAGPATVRTLCVLRPARLNCANMTVARCGDVLPLVTDPTEPSQAAIYNCSGTFYQGSESIIQLNVDTLSAMTVSIDTPELDLLEITNPPCREQACVAFGDQSISYGLVFPGTYWYVVDRALSGGNVPFTFTATCTDVYEPIACGDVVSSTTDGVNGMISRHGCNFRRLFGGEHYYLLSLATPGSIFAILDGVTPDLWVAIYRRSDFESGGNCLHAAPGGAGIQAASADDYVIVVDGESRTGGPFTLQVQCGSTPDCGGARPAGCLSVVSGDTTGGNNGLVAYSCLREALVGPEVIYRVSNPTEQTLTARFISSQPGQRLVLVTGCGSGQCLLGDSAGFSCPLLPRGTYFLVVDGLIGSEGPYQFEISCSAMVTGVDLRAVDLRYLGAPSSCGASPVTATSVVTIANLGADPALGPIDVAVYQDMPPLDATYNPGDLLFGLATLFADLPSGETADVSVPVTGTLAFRDAPMNAHVDSGLTILESVETNNVFAGSQLCEIRPPVGVFSPVIEWRWSRSPVMPNHNQVDTTPLVADIDRDGTPDVVIVAGSDAGGFTDGVVRVLAGDSGFDTWTADDPAAMVYSSSNIALGDLDRDGNIEIIGHSYAIPADVGIPRGHQLTCLNSDGSLRWISQPFIDHPLLFQGGGAPSIADIDCDGDPEIVYGKNVFNADGTYFWVPAQGGTIGVNEDGRLLDGAISVVADVDGDGVMEVIAGPTCYKLNPANIDPILGVPVGEILWRAALVPDGFPAIGQFDGDAAPEVALTAYGAVYLLEGDTGQIRWQLDLPLGGGGCAPSLVMGGPPTIADFDGDCAPEIGVGGADWYVAIETIGEIMWLAPIDDCSSHRTASSVFDFDGDGAAEVAFMDEKKLHIYRGVDGVELTSINTSSHTWQEMITIADVDADGSAEVVIPLNSPLPSGAHGVEVVGDIDSNWVNTRQIWNQHAYHIDHVNDDGTIPGPTENCETPSWQRHGTYRDQLGSAAYTAADLTLMVIDAVVIEQTSCDHFAHVEYRIGNAGGLPIGAGARIAFYDGDPLSGGRVLTTQPVLPLGPGEWWDMVVDIRLPRVGRIDLFIRADDNGAGGEFIEECRTNNNVCALVLDNPPFPDPPPLAVGNALRATSHGDPHAATCTATFNWVLDEGGPRGPDNHYHVLRSTNPRFLPIVPGTDPWVATTFIDNTPQTPDDDLPMVHYLVVIAADRCEQTETL